LRLAWQGAVFLWSAPMLINLFSAQGWESWGLEHHPLIPERMPVLIDDDLRAERSGHG
jgi:hypothetical protein